MGLAPDIVELLARARADLRMGVPVILCDGESSVIVLAAETLDRGRMADMIALAGTPVVAITMRRAETLKARAYDGDLARVRLPEGADLAWVRAIADPADDLIAPMKGPLTTERDGNANLHRLALKLSKSARLLPAALMAEVKDGHAFATTHGLTLISHAMALPHLAGRSPLHPVVSARLPMDVSEAGRLHVYRPQDGGEEHYAIEIGRPARDRPVLARLHSA